MDIPKNIIYKNRRYELVKKYPSFALYIDKQTGNRETFHNWDLGLITETEKTIDGYRRTSIW